MPRSLASWAEKPHIYMDFGMWIVDWYNQLVAHKTFESVLRSFK